MDNKSKLSKRQVELIDDLFAGEVDEQAVLARHNVSRRLYNRWQSEQDFTDEFQKADSSLEPQGRIYHRRLCASGGVKAYTAH